MGINLGPPSCRQCGQPVEAPYMGYDGLEPICLECAVDAERGAMIAAALLAAIVLGGAIWLAAKLVPLFTEDNHGYPAAIETESRR